VRTTAASTWLVAVPDISPARVCARARAFVHASSAYVNGNGGQRNAADQKTSAQCDALDRLAAAKPQQKAGLLNAYGSRVDALAGQRFLTEAQAADLKARAARL
jgi:hypothetical protein